MNTRHTASLILLVCCTLLLSNTALAQFSQQGPKLVGTGAEGNALQGSSVAISADGNTAIVGGYADDTTGLFTFQGIGAAWVWTRNGGVWSQQGTKLVGQDTVWLATQGVSVSLSADGNTAIVGGSLDGGSVDGYTGFSEGQGAAWVWTRSGGAWTQQGPKLVGSGALGNAGQGSSVSLSADGNTAIVGGATDNTYFGIPGELPQSLGAAWIWTRSAGIWTQQGAKLAGSDAVGNPGQGGSVSISADGNTAIVGGYNDNFGAGAAWVWTRSAGVWTQQGPKLVGSAAVGNGHQGWSVSVSADGNTAMVGADGDNGNTGAAWIWTRSAGGVWTQQSKLAGSGAGVGAYQGTSVSLSADGNTAIVGVPASTGNAWVWIRSAGVWTQQSNRLLGSGAVGNAQQGCSVALAADGHTAIVGGRADNGEAGSAWVFAAEDDSTIPRRRAIKH